MLAPASVTPPAADSAVPATVNTKLAPNVKKLSPNPVIASVDPTTVPVHVYVAKENVVY
jgi:hypothetical protein